MRIHYVDIFQDSFDIISFSPSLSYSVRFSTCVTFVILKPLQCFFPCIFYILFVFFIGHFDIA